MARLTTALALVGQPDHATSTVIRCQLQVLPIGAAPLVLLFTRKLEAGATFLVAMLAPRCRSPTSRSRQDHPGQRRAGAVGRPA
jgi:hypothetical protein